MARAAAALLLRAAAALSAKTPPPLFNISAPTLYLAGVRHGELARDRITSWLSTDEIGEVWRFSQDPAGGLDAYTALRKDSSEAFPVYADELRGIAKGSGVSLDKLWSAQLMIELENLMESTNYPTESPRQLTSDHCSDIYAVADGGYKEGFAEGHNEDWSVEVRGLYYYVRYTPEGPDADFAPCAGMIYPGAIPGWGVTWNAQGVFWSVNTLEPKVIRRSGVTTSFLQRDAICGLGRRGLDEVAKGLKDERWAIGASMNVVDLRLGRMANVETYEDTHSVVEVTEAMGNYTHFNTYKHLGEAGTPRAIDGQDCTTSYDRQALADSLPAPRAAADIRAMLSDDQPVKPGGTPFFRRFSTIASFVVDGSSGLVDVWCCGMKPSAGPPVYTWHLPTFFDVQAEVHGSVV